MGYLFGVYEIRENMVNHHKMINAAIATLATCAMLLPVVGSANANESSNTAVLGAGYTATKISHPNAGLGEDDGIVNVLNGESIDDLTQGLPERGQNYSWASAGYGDWMYVGTCYSAMGSTLKYMANTMGTKYASIKAALDVAFNGELFLDNGENHSLLLKINVKTGEVKIIVNAIGGEHAVNGYRAAVEFHDKLYFAAAAKGQPYLLEVDPNSGDATEIVYRSAAMTTGLKKGYTAGIRGLTVVNNQLIASMITDNGATIVASSNPSAGQDSFATIATQTEGLYNYPACAVTDGVFGGCVWDMVGFKGNLYVTMVTGTAKNNKQSFALVRGTQDKETGKWTFKPLVGDPADGAKYEWGFGASRSGAANMVVYKGHLYIGGYNDPMNALEKAMQMDFSDLYKDLESPVNLWRMDVDEDGNENFEMLAGEANNKYFGDSKGTIDGNTMLSGLGDSDEQSRHLNQYVWRMQSYNGKLYVGTFDISDLAYPATQFANGDILKRTPEEWKKQIEYIKIFFDSLKKNDQNGTSGTTDTDSQEASKPSESESQETTKPSDDDIMPLNEGEASESDQAAQAVEEAGKTDEVAADVATMQQQLEDMGADLNSKQTDVVSPDGVAPQAAETYTLDDRYQFLASLQRLLDLYNKNKQYLPEFITNELDKWLTEENLENFIDFVGVLSYLHYSNDETRGFDLIVSSDGTNFQTISRNGFGDNNNHGLRVFAVTDSGLAIGTANPYHGTQVWLLNDGEIKNAELTNGDAFDYDKYDSDKKSANANGLTVGINPNGNTVEDVQYDYQSLTAGTDYTVADDGSIVLSSAFLNGRETGSTGSVVVFYNQGARVRFTVTIKDSTPNAPKKDDDKQNTKPAAHKKANTANTGSNVIGVVVVVAVLVVAAGALFVFKRKRS